MINKQTYLRKEKRAWWIQELLRDFAEADPNRYHKFLWSNHLAYADTYEVELRFGQRNMKESRARFFSDLQVTLRELGIDPRRDIGSVFEVGCSLGYQLRHLETQEFKNAAVLEGIDIDRHAIAAGKEYLKRVGSRVKVQYGDMENLDDILGNKSYDIIICTGVLMYLGEEEAHKVVDTMMRHTGKLLAISGLAYPDCDNSQMKASVPRERDGSFIHNVDAMVAGAGGNVCARRWEGNNIVDGNTIYFVFAVS